MAEMPGVSEGRLPLLGGWVAIFTLQLVHPLSYSLISPFQSSSLTSPLPPPFQPTTGERRA